MSQDAPVVFELRNATLGYGRRIVLRDASLVVHAGEFWCVIGPNAAGKTTLLRTLLGDLAPIAGRLAVDPELAAPSRIGFVPQHCELNPTLPDDGARVREPRARRHPGRGRRIAASGFDGHSSTSISKGSSATTTSGSPGDSGSAPCSRGPSFAVRRCWSSTSRPRSSTPSPSGSCSKPSATLNVRDGVTVIFVTHELDIAMRYATHVAFVRGGSMVSGVHDRDAHSSRPGRDVQRRPLLLRGPSAVTRYSHRTS